MCREQQGFQCGRADLVRRAQRWETRGAMKSLPQGDGAFGECGAMERPAPTWAALGWLGAVWGPDCKASRGNSRGTSRVAIVRIRQVMK